MIQFRANFYCSFLLPTLQASSSKVPLVPQRGLPKINKPTNSILGVIYGVHGGCSMADDILYGGKYSINLLQSTSDGTVWTPLICMFPYGLPPYGNVRWWRSEDPSAAAAGWWHICISIVSCAKGLFIYCRCVNILFSSPHFNCCCSPVCPSVSSI